MARCRDRGIGRGEAMLCDSGEFAVRIGRGGCALIKPV